MLVKELKFTKDKDIVKDKYIDDILKNMKITLFGFIPGILSACVFDQHVKYILDCHYKDTEGLIQNLLSLSILYQWKVK